MRGGERHVCGVASRAAWWSRGPRRRRPNVCSQQAATFRNFSGGVGAWSAVKVGVEVGKWPGRSWEDSHPASQVGHFSATPARTRRAPSGARLGLIKGVVLLGSRAKGVCAPLPRCVSPVVMGTRARGEPEYTCTKTPPLCAAKARDSRGHGSRLKRRVQSLPSRGGAA